MQNRIVDLVFGVVGLFLTYAAVHAYVTYGQLLVAGERATGRVVTIETMESVESDLYAPVIELTTGRGEAIIIRGPASSGKTYDIGQSVSVAYRREDPHAGRVVDAMSALAGPSIELLMGLGFIALMIARLASRHHRNREQEAGPYEVDEIKGPSGDTSQTNDNGQGPRSTTHEALESGLVAADVIRDSGDNYPAWAPSAARPALTPSERERGLRALFLRTRLAQWGVGSSLLLLLLAPVGKSAMPAAVTRAMIALALPLLGVSIVFSVLLRPKCPQCRTYVGGAALFSRLQSRCPRCGLSIAPED